MLEAKAGGSTESEPSRALLAFKPRQLLLAAHTKPTQMKKQNSKTLNSHEGVNILHSILCYLDSHGFPRSVKRILSEAQIENDGWKTHVHKLEDMRGSYLEKLSSKEAVTDTSKEQDDAAMKKKKSNQSDAISLSVADNSSIKSSKAPSDDTVLEHLVDESNLKQDKKKKRKTKSMPEAVDSKPGHVKFESQSQVDGKPTKDKKKKKGSSDSLVQTSEQFKVAPEPISEIPMVQKKDKSKEKRRRQEISDSDEALAVRVDEVSRLDGLTTEKISEDAVDKQKKISKKRKRLESDTIDGKAVEELATNELKRLKTKATEETKSIEQLGYENELCKESEGQNGHVQNESKKSIVQEPEVNANDAHKTGKYQRNGSTEPRTVNAFQRVKVEEVEFVDDRLQDNSYWAKDGAEIGYGAKAQEVLGQVRGRDFRHEKTKKKRGSYRGGQIDLQSHSIKFNYDDEDD